MLKTIIDSVRTATSLVQPDTSALEERRIQAEQDYLLNNQTKTEVVENPITIKTETGAENTDKPVYFQRTQISNNTFEAKYDKKAESNDILRLKANLGNGFGAAIYNAGDFNGKDQNYIEAWKTFKTDNADILIDGGAGFGKPTEPKAFIIGKYETDNLMLEAGIFQIIKDLGDLEKSFYGAVSYDLGNVQAGAGTNPNNSVADLMIKGFEDFGNFTYATYDKNTGDLFFKTQTGVQDVDQEFFSNYIADLTAEYFGVPPFFSLHFSPVMTKADFTNSIAGKVTDDNTWLETVFGVKTDYVNVGLGLDNLNENGKNNTNFVGQLHKDFNILGINGSAEAKYTARTGEVSGYLMMNYELR